VVDAPVTSTAGARATTTARYFAAVTCGSLCPVDQHNLGQLGEEVGFAPCRHGAAHGITTPVNTHPSMVLGTSDVRLLDMTRAFASVSRRAWRWFPYGIVRVTTPKGELLYQHEPTGAARAGRRRGSPPT
jgi:penicillin-binding protein 1A